MSARPEASIAAASRRSISEQVAEQIRGYIQSEGLGRGDRLGREEDLARRFGVSRPTLREALRTLSSAHLIRASKGPGGGIFVAATPEEGMGRSVSELVASMLAAESISFGELLETRLLFEVPLVGLAAQRASEEDVARLEALVAEEDSVGSGPAAADEDRLRRIDGQLHRMISSIAGNRLAAVFTEWVVEVFQPSLQALVAPAVVEAVIVEQHRDMVRAIARGDPRAAERAMREHLVYLSDLVQAVASRPDAAGGGGGGQDDGS